jgi:hypothetical protein
MIFNRFQRARECTAAESVEVRAQMTVIERWQLQIIPPNNVRVVQTCFGIWTVHDDRHCVDLLQLRSMEMGNDDTLCFLNFDIENKSSRP